jgi:hypothetical protein
MNHVNPLYILGLCFLTSCTITFDQVMTYGKADDVIDNTPSTNVTSEVTLPLIP